MRDLWRAAFVAALFHACALPEATLVEAGGGGHGGAATTTASATGAGGATATASQTGTTQSAATAGGGGAGGSGGHGGAGVGGAAGAGGAGGSAPLPCFATDCGVDSTVPDACGTGRVFALVPSEAPGADGAFFVLGDYRGTFDWAGCQLSSAIEMTVFVAKLDKDLACTWAVRISTDVAGTPQPMALRGWDADPDRLYVSVSAPTSDPQNHITIVPPNTTVANGKRSAVVSFADADGALGADRIRTVNGSIEAISASQAGIVLGLRGAPGAVDDAAGTAISVPNIGALESMVLRVQSLADITPDWTTTFGSSAAVLDVDASHGVKVEVSGHAEGVLNAGGMMLAGGVGPKAFAATLDLGTGQPVLGSGQGTGCPGGNAIGWTSVVGAPWGVAAAGNLAGCEVASACALQSDANANRGVAAFLGADTKSCTDLFADASGATQGDARSIALDASNRLILGGNYAYGSLESLALGDAGQFWNGYVVGFDLGNAPRWAALLDAPANVELTSVAFADASQKRVLVGGTIDAAASLSGLSIGTVCNGLMPRTPFVARLAPPP